MNPRIRPRCLPGLRAPVAVLAAAVLGSVGVAHASAEAAADAAPPGGEGLDAAACVGGTSGAAVTHPAVGALDPDRIEMATTRRARGGSGTLILRLASSPTGVDLSADGSYRYDVTVSVEELPPLDGGTYVVWAATPELDRHERLGAVGRSGSVDAVVGWNKFLVFVTAEASAEVDEWSQSIVLSARSPSGRMHTMAGHGPFSGEPCLDPRP